MNDQRSKILSMLAEGKISVDEAERLLDALQGGTIQSVGSAAQDATGVAKKKAKFLRVHVDGDEKVDIKLPMQLLRSGLKLSKLLPGHARARVDAALQEKGISFNMDNLNENVDELLDSLSEFSIDVDDKGESVRIFFE